MLSNAEQTRLRTRYGAWAVVTGASSGIGLECAEQLAEAGMNVILVARRKSLLQNTANIFSEKYRVQTIIIEADVATDAGIDAVIAQSNGVDVGLFIASAGFGTSGLFTEIPLEEERSMLKVNCDALLCLTHHFATRFKSQGRGGIILLSSMVAFQGVPFAAHYAATKAFVQTLAEALHVELKPFGVDVLAAAPGPVATGFADVADMKMSMALKPSDVGEPILRALGRTSTVLPGALTKLLVYALRTVPRFLKVRIMQVVMGGMTEHQRKKHQRKKHQRKKHQ